MSQIQQNEKLFLLFFIAAFSQFSTEIDCLDPPSLFLLKNKQVNICQERFSCSRYCPRDGACFLVVPSNPPSVRSPTASTCSSCSLQRMHASSPTKASLRLVWLMKTRNSSCTTESDKSPTRGGAGRLRRSRHPDNTSTSSASRAEPVCQTADSLQGQIFHNPILLRRENDYVSSDAS